MIYPHVSSLACDLPKSFKIRVRVSGGSYFLGISHTKPAPKGNSALCNAAYCIKFCLKISQQKHKQLLNN